MIKMMASLGLFVFTLKTAPFQELKRKTSWKWVSNNRIGQRASYQYTGPGEDTITLSGVLMPEVTGGRITLDAIRIMADQGKSWPLIDGEGTIYGYWFVESVEETRSVFFANGAARKIEFTLNLKRADSSMLDQIGALSRTGLGLLK